MKAEVAKQVREQVKEQEKQNLEKSVDHMYVEDLTDELKKKGKTPDKFI